MTTKNSNKIRAQFIEKLFKFFEAEGEDVGMITSGSFNFPVTAEDGEEGSVQIVVKVPKIDETYELREEYEMKLKAKAEKAEKKNAKND